MSNEIQRMAHIILLRFKRARRKTGRNRNNLSVKIPTQGCSVRCLLDYGRNGINAFGYVVCREIIYIYIYLNKGTEKMKFAFIKFENIFLNYYRIVRM